MRMHVQKVPYSSVVGGGLTLSDDTGRARFVVSLMGTTEGITKEESDAISSRLAELIDEHGLDVPERDQ